MKEKMILSKICSIYASDLHFATMIFPYINKEIEKDTSIKTILEKDEQENIEKILENIGLNLEIKKRIRNIDWKNTNINKIRNNFKFLEAEIKNNKKIDIIVAGSNIFINKVNLAIDLWVKNNIENLEKYKTKLNIVNCFSFDENKNSYDIIGSHDYILRTSGVEKVLEEQDLLKAN